jgi:eukaryotic-like serine/threonine-protein kinase
VRTDPTSSAGGTDPLAETRFRPPDGFDVLTHDPTPPVPTRLAGTADIAAAEPQRYRAVRTHARGGLGEVFVAEDAQLGRRVALKRMQARLRSDPEARRRFLLAAEVTRRLEHPGVVPVYSLTADAHGDTWGKPAEASHWRELPAGQAAAPR